jgi:hypothetical protein
MCQAFNTILPRIPRATTTNTPTLNYLQAKKSDRIFLFETGQAALFSAHEIRSKLFFI